MNSQQLIQNFKSGSLIPVYEAMYSEVPAMGFQENQKVSKLQNQSNCLGRLTAKIAKGVFPDAKNHGILDHLVYQQNKKKPFNFQKTLLKPLFAKGAEQHLQGDDRQVYAALLLEAHGEADNAAFLSGYFRELSKNS